MVSNETHIRNINSSNDFHWNDLTLEIIYRALRARNFQFAQINQEVLKFQKIAFDNKYGVSIAPT